MTLKFKVELIQEPDGGYIAHVPALPGCHTQGDSFDEVIENVKDAIQLYMDVLSEESTISPTNSQSQPLGTGARVLARSRVGMSATAPASG